MKRIPNAGDTSQAPSQGSSKRPYIRKAAGTTTAATPGLETYEAGMPKRKSHSTKFEFKFGMWRLDDPAKLSNRQRGKRSQGGPHARKMLKSLKKYASGTCGRRK